VQAVGIWSRIGKHSRALDRFDYPFEKQRLFVRWASIRRAIISGSTFSFPGLYYMEYGIAYSGKL
jgi:hypothetical protein